MTKVRKKAIAARFNKIYLERCAGVQIPILSMSKIFAEGEKAILEGLDDKAVGDRIAAAVEAVRAN